MDGLMDEEILVDYSSSPLEDMKIFSTQEELVYSWKIERDESNMDIVYWDMLVLPSSIVEWSYICY